MKTQAHSLWIGPIAASFRLRIAREEVAQAVGRGTPGLLPSRKVNAMPSLRGYFRAGWKSHHIRVLWV